MKPIVAASLLALCCSCADAGAETDTGFCEEEHPSPSVALVDARHATCSCCTDDSGSVTCDCCDVCGCAIATLECLDAPKCTGAPRRHQAAFVDPSCNAHSRGDILSGGTDAVCTCCGDACAWILPTNGGAR